MNKPQPNEYGDFYQNYIDQVNEDVFLEVEKQLTSVPSFFNNIPFDKRDYAYAIEKWTIKEVLGHIIDTERIMAYRLLRISRGDATPLPGFDENNYIETEIYRNRDYQLLIEEFKAVRTSNLFLIKHLNQENLSYIGSASGYPISAKALLFIMAGHIKHHIEIIESRYL